MPFNYFTMLLPLRKSNCSKIVSILKLTLVEQKDDFLERFHEIHILVAEFLHLQN